MEMRTDGCLVADAGSAVDCYKYNLCFIFAVDKMMDRYICRYAT